MVSNNIIISTHAGIQYLVYHRLVSNNITISTHAGTQQNNNHYYCHHIGIFLHPNKA